MKCAALGIRFHVARRPVRRCPLRRPLRAVRCDAEAASVAAASLVKVKFTIPHHVEYGQSVCVLGSAAQLGDWQVEKSPCLTWNEGDIWSGVVQVPPGALEYKYFIKNADGSPLEWQPCENLTMKIDEGDEIEVKDRWDGRLQELEQEIEQNEKIVVEDAVVMEPVKIEEPPVESAVETVVVLEAEEEEEEVPQAVQELAEEVVTGEGAPLEGTKEGTLSA